MNVLEKLSPSVFISYAHEDKPYAHRLAGALEERGCQVWVDDFELRVGDSLTERISGALTTADFVITLISLSSVDSNWCRRELQIALATGLSSGRTIVLPVRLGAVQMPASLADVLYVPAGSDAPDTAADRLVKDMASHATDLERRRAIQATAREWEFAVEPAHELDSLLGDLEQEMEYLFEPDAPRRPSFAEAGARWSTLVDKWKGGNRLPLVLGELAWRLEDLLAAAAAHEETLGNSTEARRRLDEIVSFGLIETRELMSTTTADPALLADTALEDCSIPERDHLTAMFRDDPQLIDLHARIVPDAVSEED